MPVALARLPMQLLPFSPAPPTQHCPQAIEHVVLQLMREHNRGAVRVLNTYQVGMDRGEGVEGSSWRGWAGPFRRSASAPRVTSDPEPPAQL